LGKSPEYSRTFINEVERVTPDQLRRLAERLLDQPRVAVELVPNK
jgi:predicted Zn-dependent peptidase